jgi:GntR family transcriptional repressor for pyruvate dehydrogenase complex
MKRASPFPAAIKKQTLAEQVAGSIKEAILAGEWSPGEALPTEPELAQAFGVSRAVVRDATRMLAAQGLVEAHHGRGVFVTESQVEAFGDALLLALRRDGASVWDVEQFEQMVFPEVCALCAAEVSDEELDRLRELAETYLDLYPKVLSADWNKDDPNAAAVSEAFKALITAIFDATHNALWQLLARPIVALRSIRYWEVENAEDSQDDSNELFAASERRFVATLVSAIASGDPSTARETVAKLMRLPPEAEAAMRSTPVGDKPLIRIDRPPPLDDQAS